MSDPAAPQPPKSPVRYGSRYDSNSPPGARDCPACAMPRPSTRARYCSDACKQRAYRSRQVDAMASDPTSLVTTRNRSGGRVAHTVYACPLCDARYLGQQRCPDCNRFCRALGLGGDCPQCDEPILIAELLGEEVLR